MNLTKIILIVIFLSINFMFLWAEEIPRALPVHMTQEDIIQLSQAGISDEVIINQIKATRSTFFLSNEEIITLKQANVNDSVINFMVETGIEIPRAILVEPPVRIRYYYSSDPWYDYWWGDPWYDDWWWRRRRWRHRWW